MSAIDLIIRVKNGYMAGKEEITIPHSKLNASVLKKLKDLHYIADFSEVGEVKKVLKAMLIYADKNPRLSGVTLVSRPGQRAYTPYSQLKPVKDGLGVSIISTSKGIVTDKEAKRMKIGGELLFHIW